MITANIYHRTYRIRVNQSYGTCFAIDVDQRQYLITAKHVVNGLPNHGQVAIFYQNDWYPITVSRVGELPGTTDLSILAPDVQLTPRRPLPLNPSSDGIVFGQDVYFLGFPYNLFADIGEMNRNFPLPFVKKAILSSMSKDENDVQRFFLDGHNNPGFSGGPVVFKKPGENEYSVASVISGYRYERSPIYRGESATPFEHRDNTGIVISYDIDAAVQLIHSNPIGASLTRCG